MSLVNINSFLLQELDEVKIKIKNLDKEIRENKLRIDEADYFIKDLSSSKKSELTSSYISEKSKADRLKIEKEKFEQFNSVKVHLESEKMLLTDKEKKLNLYIDSLEKISKSIDLNQKNNLSMEYIDNLNSIIIFIKNEMDESNEFLKNSFENYGNDFNRIKTDYIIFNKRMTRLSQKFNEAEDFIKLIKGDDLK